MTSVLPLALLVLIKGPVGLFLFLSKWELSCTTTTHLTQVQLFNVCRLLKNRGKGDTSFVSVSHRRLDVKPKHDSDLDKKPPDKTRKEKHSEEHKDDKKHPEEPQNEKHPQEIRKEKHLEKQGDAEDTPLLMDNKKQKHQRDLQSERFKPEPEREGSSGEPKKRHMEEVKREKRPGEPKRHSYADDMKKDKHREENRHRRPISSPQWERTPSEPQREKPAGLKPIFER